MANVPSDLKYAKTHEWVRVSGNLATVGITDHAQHELTDLVFVELTEVGRKIKLKLTTEEVECSIQSIEKLIDASTLMKKVSER